MSKLKLGFALAWLIAAAACAAAQQQPRDQSFMHVWQGNLTAHRPAMEPGFEGGGQQTPPPHKKHNTVVHAIKHAGHWVNHHVSAPHGKAYQHRAARRKHNVNHAVKHTEHWLNHHLSAPHKNAPPKGGK